MLAWLIAHKECIYATFGVPFIAFTLSKFPDPRLFEGKWYYAPYFGFFQMATYYSAGEWNKWGFGKASMPFTQTPKLSETIHPLLEKLSFSYPAFYLAEETKDTVKLP